MVHIFKSNHNRSQCQKYTNRHTYGPRRCFAKQYIRGVSSPTARARDHGQPSRCTTDAVISTFAMDLPSQPPGCPVRRDHLRGVFGQCTPFVVDVDLFFKDIQEALDRLYTTYNTPANEIHREMTAVDCVNTPPDIIWCFTDFGANICQSAQEICERHSVLTKNECFLSFDKLIKLVRLLLLYTREAAHAITPKRTALYRSNAIKTAQNWHNLVRPEDLGYFKECVLKSSSAYDTIKKFERGTHLRRFARAISRDTYLCAGWKSVMCVAFCAAASKPLAPQRKALFKCGVRRTRSKAHKTRHGTIYNSK